MIHWDSNVENVAADADSAWPQLSAEAVVEANPDVYISLYSTLEDVQQTAGLSDLACLNEDGDSPISMVPA